MSSRFHRRGAAAWIALSCGPALGAQLEEVQTIIGWLPALAFALFALMVAALVYSMRSRDKRAAPLSRVFAGRETVHFVPPETPVIDCVRKMTAEKVGALIVMDGERLVGIFTERDALNKVLAAGRDPAATRVSAVMTTDLCCLSPATTVGAAMEVVTRRRFRHLPIVENGELLAVVSSGDLTHWLVQDQVAEVRELADLAERS